MVPSDILGVERRRRWQDDEKLAILERVGMGGRTVSDVAREADVSRQHIYQWRQEMRRKGLWPRASGALFVPVEDEVVDLPCATSTGADGDLQIEIGLRNGRQLRCTPSISPAVLARLIHILEAA
jgi:transposase